MKLQKGSPDMTNPFLENLETLESFARDCFAPVSYQTAKYLVTLRNAHYLNDSAYWQYLGRAKETSHECPCCGGKATAKEIVEFQTCSTCHSEFLGIAHDLSWDEAWAEVAEESNE